MSVAHQPAIMLPEPADRRLTGWERLRFRLVPAHHDEARAVVVVMQRALHEPADAPILHRDIPRWADQIPLTQPAFGHRLVIRVEAEMDPFEFGLVDTAGPDHPYRDGVAHLLQHHAGEDSQNLN